MCDLKKSILTLFPTVDSAFHRLDDLAAGYKDLVKSWSFGQNAKLKSRKDEINTLKVCITTFYKLVSNKQQTNNNKFIILSLGWRIEE